MQFSIHGVVFSFVVDDKEKCFRLRNDVGDQMCVAIGPGLEYHRSFVSHSRHMKLGLNYEISQAQTWTCPPHGANRIAFFHSRI